MRRFTSPALLPILIATALTTLSGGVASAAPDPAAPPAAEPERPRRIEPPRTPPPPEARARAASPEGVRATPPPRTPPPPPARATTVKKKAKLAKPKLRNGWHYKLALGLNTALAHNHRIPGVADGLSFTLGAVLEGELKYVHNSLRWVTGLKIVNAHAKTPVLKPFIKTADQFDLLSLVIYRMKGKMKKVFLSGGVQLVGSFFPGDLVPAADTDLVLTATSGSVTTDLALANDRFRLTPAFAPLTFRQLVGTGAIAYESDLATLTLTLGAASQQVWASGWTPADDKATPELEMVALRDFQQFGVTTGFTVHGKVHKRLIYSIITEFYYPMVTSFVPVQKGFDLMNIEVAFKLSLKIAKWVSVDYLLSARRYPLIVDQWQLTNNLVLAINADVL